MLVEHATRVKRLTAPAPEAGAAISTGSRRHNGRLSINPLIPIALAGCLLVGTRTPSPLQSETTKQDDSMQLGNFSVSLTVKDIKVSHAFYEKLDFKLVAGKLEQNR
jgi:hypothetical protein